MSDFQNLWDDTPAAETRRDKEMTDVPDGPYDGVLIDFSCFKSAGGDWLISWWIEVDTGLNSGALLQRFQGVTDKAVPWIKSDFRTVLGRIPSWEEMANEMTGQTGPVREEVVGARLRVRQKSRKYDGTTYRDVFINELLNAPPGPAPTESYAETRQEPPMEDDQLTEAQQDTQVQEAQQGAEGWGDPDCPTCAGAGCEGCVAF